MNKRDFYKELMKEYTFDSAKVRRTAKTSSLKRASVFSFANSRRVKVAGTAAAACLAMVVGWFAINYSPQEVVGVPVVSVQERIIRSEVWSRSASVASETMYLSFDKSLTYDEMQETLDSASNSESIIVKAVYVFDSNGDNNVAVLSAPNELDELRTSDASEIIGAKITGSSESRDDLKRRENVILIEFESENMNDKIFVPIAAIEGAVEEVISYTETYRTPETTAATEASVQTTDARTCGCGHICDNDHGDEPDCCDDFPGCDCEDSTATNCECDCCDDYDDGICEVCPLQPDNCCSCISIGTSAISCSCGECNRCVT